jgi:hypothetical protein
MADLRPPEPTTNGAAASVVAVLPAVEPSATDPHNRRGTKTPAQRRPRTAWIPVATEGYEDDEERYYDDEDLSDSAAAAPAAARARVSGSRDASGDESDGFADWGLPTAASPLRLGTASRREWKHRRGSWPPS